MFNDEDIDDVGHLLVDAKNINATCSAQEFPHHSLTLKGTPLHWAVLTRNKCCVQVLLQLGADIELAYDDRTALDLAVEFHLFDIVEVLLSNGASFESGSGFGRKSTHLIAGNASILQRRLIHSSDYKRAAALTLKKLEIYGGDIDARDDFLNTPLHRAVASPLERCDLYVIRLLLGSGADRNAQNSDGDTILHIGLRLAWCDRPNDLDVMKLLLDRDVGLAAADINPNLRDSDGFTPFHLLVAQKLSSEHINLFLGSFPEGKGDIVMAKTRTGENFPDLMGGTIEHLLYSTQSYVKSMKGKGLGVLPGFNYTS
jgi:ankyrin repeat protein